MLGHGINVTNWFRFPPSADPCCPARLSVRRGRCGSCARPASPRSACPCSPSCCAAIRTRIRLLTGAIGRLQRHGLAVVVAAQPAAWHLETSAGDRASLLAFWAALAPALRAMDPRLTFPELLNEPVFPGTPEAWRTLAARSLLAVRADLPHHTIVLSGNDWGSIAGLLALAPGGRSERDLQLPLSTILPN